MQQTYSNAAFDKNRQTDLRQSKTALTQPFTCQDLEKSIKQMANGKSAGLDGLPAEFYKQFFDLIADDLLLVFTEHLHSGRMSASQCTGLITLLYKKDRSDLKNWRPIALLNCNHKILSKMISLRLANVLEDITEPDQTEPVDMACQQHLFSQLDVKLTP